MIRFLLTVLLSSLFVSSGLAQNSLDIQKIQRLLEVTSQTSYQFDTLGVSEDLVRNFDGPSSTYYSMSRYRFPSGLDTIYQSFDYSSWKISTGFIFDYVTTGDYDLVGALKVKRDLYNSKGFIEAAARLGMMQVSDGFSTQTKSSAILISTGFRL